MTKYKVFGDMLSSFYIDIDASTEDEAWDIADKSEPDKWTLIGISENVEVHFVEETLELEDGYPSMNNEIIITEGQDS